MKKLKRMLSAAVVAGLTLEVALVSGSAWAADKANTSILPGSWGSKDGDGVAKLLKLVMNILLYGLGALAIIGVVIAGIMYLTARDNEQQVAKAKTRLIEVVIGLFAWAIMFTVLNWLIPGFNSSILD